MAISALVSQGLTVTETLPDAFANSQKNAITFDKLNTTKTLNASSTPPASVHACFEVALSAGAATIDLTSLTGTNGATVSGTGLKVQAIKFKPNAANANPITVNTGASNGYVLAGASWKLGLSAGDDATLYLPAHAPTIDSTHKTIDLAGTGSQSMDIEIIMG